MTATATGQGDDSQQVVLQLLQSLHREILSLREEVAELRRLPAPSPTSTPPSPTETITADESSAARAESEDDPHGFKALIQAMREKPDSSA